MSSSPISVLLYPQLWYHYRGSSASFLFDSRVRCDNGETDTDLECLLESGLGISILPRAVRRRLGVQVQTLPGWQGKSIPTWHGIPCRIGRITLSISGFWFNPLVRVPVLKKRWMPPYLLIGTEFLISKKAIVRLNCTSAVNLFCPDMKSCTTLVRGKHPFFRWSEAR
jgi:hypothetical protein